MIETRENPWVADWQSGRFHRRWADPPEETAGAVTVVVAGDWAPGPEQEEALLADPHSFYGEIASVFEDADLSAANLEMPVCSVARPAAKDGPALALGHQLVAAGLGSLGCSIACLANNHIMDFGAEGLAATLDALQGLNIQAIGAGRAQDQAREPFVADVHGCQIAFLNLAEGEEAKASAQSPGAAALDVPRACSQIKQLARSSNAVIVIVHAGREFIPIPPPYIRAAYRALADAGASIVIGHHPHVPQGIELWNGVPIVYSLGHFVFWVNPMLWCRSIGCLLSLQVSSKGIVAFEIDPFEVGQTGLALLEGARRTTFLAELEGISQRIASPFLEEFWNAYADLWWQSRLPEELISFTMLMSWQDWARAIGHRVGIKIQETRGLRRLIGRALRRSLHVLAKRLPSERPADPRVAAVLRNRFDTSAHCELYKTALGRAVAGTTGEAASWAKELLERWEVKEWRAYH